VQGNYSVIICRDWIHVNRCVPSTLHKFLIQWIGDVIEVVHTDGSTYIALADAMADWNHGSAQCFLGKDLTIYNVTKEGFVHVSIKLASEARLGNVVLQ
jgi:hypothetical protein